VRDGDVMKGRIESERDCNSEQMRLTELHEREEEEEEGQAIDQQKQTTSRANVRYTTPTVDVRKEKSLATIMDDIFTELLRVAPCPIHTSLSPPSTTSSHQWSSFDLPESETATGDPNDLWKECRREREERFITDREGREERGATLSGQWGGLRIQEEEGEGEEMDKGGGRSLVSSQ
jgi:hypothetical protein